MAAGPWIKHAPLPSIQLFRSNKGIVQTMQLRAFLIAVLLMMERITFLYWIWHWRRYLQVKDLFDLREINDAVGGYVTIVPHLAVGTLGTIQNIINDIYDAGMTLLSCIHLVISFFRAIDDSLYIIYLHYITYKISITFSTALFLQYNGVVVSIIELMGTCNNESATDERMSHVPSFCLLPLNLSRILCLLWGWMR